ncbi:MAG: metallophosphoesterase, partial [Chloroflexi bacterium]|nr:metallophosphoesterase [Chloroflexota bacterium]
MAAFKFGFLTDSHVPRYADLLTRLTVARDWAVTQGADYIIAAGDMVDGPTYAANLDSIILALSGDEDGRTPKPFFWVPGNHDHTSTGITHQTVLTAIQRTATENLSPQAALTATTAFRAKFTLGTKTDLIVLDGTYNLVAGEYVHPDAIASPGGDASYISPADITWLDAALTESEAAGNWAIIVVHKFLYYTQGSLAARIINWRQVQETIAAHGNVLAIVNGHNHTGFIRSHGFGTGGRPIQIITCSSILAASTGRNQALILSVDEDTGKLSAVTSGSTWEASTAYALGDIVKPTVRNYRVYECTLAGTSGSVENYTVTAATNAASAVLTVGAGHTLQVNNKVTLSGMAGTGAGTAWSTANGQRTITAKDADAGTITISLNTSAYNTYTASSGTAGWTTTPNGLTGDGTAQWTAKQDLAFDTYEWLGTDATYPTRYNVAANWDLGAVPFETDIAWLTSANNNPLLSYSIVQPDLAALWAQTGYTATFTFGAVADYGLRVQVLSTHSGMTVAFSTNGGLTVGQWVGSPTITAPTAGNYGYITLFLQGSGLEFWSGTPTFDVSSRFRLRFWANNTTPSGTGETNAAADINTTVVNWGSAELQVYNTFSTPAVSFEGPVTCGPFTPKSTSGTQFTLMFNSLTSGAIDYQTGNATVVLGSGTHSIGAVVVTSGTGHTLTYGGNPTINGNQALAGLATTIASSTVLTAGGDVTISYTAATAVTV